MSKYTKEMKLDAVQFYITYDFSRAAVRNALGYPDNRTLKTWYKEFQADPIACFIKKERKPRTYSIEHREEAVKHYLDHGKCYNRTTRMLGYSNRNRLRPWIGALAKEPKKLRVNKISIED